MAPSPGRSKVSFTAASTVQTITSSFESLPNVLSTFHTFDAHLVMMLVTWEQIVMIAMDEAVIDKGSMARSLSEWSKRDGCGSLKSFPQGGYQQAISEPHIKQSIWESVKRCE